MVGPICVSLGIRESACVWPLETRKYFYRPNSLFKTPRESNTASQIHGDLDEWRKILGLGLFLSRTVSY